jgi:hypothetical protein
LAAERAAAAEAETARLIAEKEDADAAAAAAIVAMEARVKNARLAVEAELADENDIRAAEAVVSSLFARKTLRSSIFWRPFVHFNHARLYQPSLALPLLSLCSNILFLFPRFLPYIRAAEVSFLFVFLFFVWRW